MKLLLLGFGTVGQGLAELLIKKETVLKDNYNLECRVVGKAEVSLPECVKHLRKLMK